MNELLAKLKTNYPNLTLSRVHLGRIVIDINITLKQTWLQKKKGLTYDELVKNIKDVLYEIPIHIYKNLIKGTYDRSEKYIKIPSTRKMKPKKISGLGRRLKCSKV